MATHIGVDVGGTFTDVVLMDDAAATLAMVKVPSVPPAPERAVLNGLAAILAKTGSSPQAVQRFIHGTTVATNAILEGKGAPTALLVTAGFKDILSIARQDRPRLYEPRVERPSPIVPRHLTFEVPERLRFDGSILRPLDEEAVKEICRQLRDLRVTAVAICFLHAYANFAHELRAKAIVEEQCPEVTVCASCEVLPEMREYERMNTTAMNAYVQPVMSRYFTRLDTALKSAGVQARLHIMQSNGGIMTAATAAQRCVQTALSGPAAGAQAALLLATRAGYEHAIAIDIGGTSADISLTYNGRLSYTRDLDLRGQALRVTSVDIHTVGAGGGSIAWIDAGGALQVGPQSAGADPGPVCYGKGGTQPTVCDANVALGRLHPEHLLGGAMPINRQAACRAIDEQIAARLGLPRDPAAEGILRVVNATMVKGIKYVSVEKGYDPRDCILVAFGGSGPLHGSDLAAELGMRAILVPAAPGVNSALGLLLADFRFDYARTKVQTLASLSADELEGHFVELEEQARRQLLQDGVPPSSVSLRRSVELRYCGQGAALEVPVAADVDGAAVLADLAAAFHAAHMAAYGFSHPQAELELVNVLVAAVGALPKPDLACLAAGVATDGGAHNAASPAPVARRPVYFHGRYLDTPVYARAALSTGLRMSGPAIIEQVDSTTLVSPEQEMLVDAFGNLMLTFR
ncbi:MAG: hydantoinase/oxoprolinase family protein [Candidatus Tectomicrobia bacterium]|nr:hydantoinase/oxoprolinase family protein [Candidatus Tectomicrobia bacterium]